MINKNNLIIGVVQFAVNIENNSHFLAEYPLGSISRMFAELISENLLYLGLNSDVASLIISKPEEKTHKQLMYTSILPIETVRKVFEGQYYDYLIFGEIKFENTLKVEVSLINSVNEKSFRREISLKSYNLFDMSVKIIKEIVSLIEHIDIDLEKISEISPYSSNNLKSWGWYSLSYENDLDNDDKLVALNKSFENSPEFLIAKLKLIITSIQNKKYHFEELNETIKNIDYKLINYFATLLNSKKEYKIAFDLFKISYKNNSNQNIDILSQLIILSHDNKDKENLDYYIEEYIEKANEDNFNYNDIPLILYNNDRKKLALEKTLKGLEIYPDSFKINSTLAYIYMNEDNLIQSEKYYEKSFYLSKSSGVLEDWSSVLLKSDKNEKLIEVFNKYFDDLPFNSGLSCNLAIAYININQQDKAIETLEKAVKSDINNVRLNSLLGNIYLEKKSYARAQKYFSLAIQNDPKNYNWYINMGNLFFEQEDFNESEKHYIRAKQIKNDLIIPQYIIIQGYHFKRDKKYQESLNKFIKASKLLPDSFIPIYEIAKLFFENNSIDESLEILEKNLDKFSDQVQILELLNKVYLEKSNSFFGKKWKIKAKDISNKVYILKNKI